MDPAVPKITTEQRVPNGSDGSLLGAFLGWAFVPSAVTDGWKENDDLIRQRAAQEQSSTEIMARAASSDAMAKSAKNISQYVSAPFIGDTYERDVSKDAVKIVGESITDAPNVFRNSADSVFNWVLKAVPWWVWAIGIVFVILQLIPLFRSLKTAQ